MPLRDGTSKSNPSVTAQSATTTTSSPSWQSVAVNDHFTPSPTMAPSAHETPVQKRPRKTTSRAAREAQRKLNHSMIEKVRRTKINEALATLKALVPLDYGQQSAHAASDNEEDDEHAGNDAADRDGDTVEKADGSRPSKKLARLSVKKEKEKEYKLEILVRTVAFVQDLVEKVKVLQDADRDKSLCPKCGASRDSSVSSSPSSRKRKRTFSSDGPEFGTNKCPSPEVARLPSISSWLPHASRTSPSTQPPRYAFHLPSPPSSTLVDPVKSTQHPPALTLDIPLQYKSSPNSPFSHRSASIMTSTISATGDSIFPVSPQRTPEDESAASLLLQIGNSPHSHAVAYSGPIRSPTSPTFELPKAANAALGSSSRHRQPSRPSQVHSSFQAQTPSSLLGLDRLTHQRPS